MHRYPCEMESCSNQVPIRSRIKQGEHKGKKVCPHCYNRLRPIKKQTQKNKIKRKDERSNFPAYYQYHIPRVSKCENCDKPILKPNVSNVCHIIPKGKFKSVGSILDNYLYMCLSCHSKYDSSWVKAMSMSVWPLAVKRFKKFEKFIVEKSLILNHFKDESSEV